MARKNRKESIAKKKVPRFLLTSCHFARLFFLLSSYFPVQKEHLVIRAEHKKGDVCAYFKSVLTIY